LATPLAAAASAGVVAVATLAGAFGVRVAAVGRAAAAPFAGVAAAAVTGLVAALGAAAALVAATAGAALEAGMGVAGTAVGTGELPLLVLVFVTALVVLALGRGGLGGGNCRSLGANGSSSRPNRTTTHSSALGSSNRTIWPVWPAI
jgi:hypothetical protein